MAWKKKKNGKEYLVMNKFQHDEKFAASFEGCYFRVNPKHMPSKRNFQFLNEIVALKCKQ